MNITAQIGFQEKLNYHDPSTQNLITKHKLLRGISWFNPFYSESVKTKIGKFFSNLIKNIFHKNINSTQSLTETL